MPNERPGETDVVCGILGLIISIVACNETNIDRIIVTPETEIIIEKEDKPLWPPKKTKSLAIT